MLIGSYVDLYQDFDGWSGGAAYIKRLKMLPNAEELFDQLEGILEDGQGVMTETELNDIFWFDGDWIAEIFGYENEDEIWEITDEMLYEKADKGNG